MASTLLILALMLQVCFAKVNEQGCGKRKEPSVTRRIVGGNEAKIEEFPWHVGLEMPDSGKIECGATLINREWAVSAGHCFKPFVVKPKFIDEENSRSPDCYPVMPKFRGKFKAVFGEDDQGGKSPHERKRVIDYVCWHTNYDGGFDWDLGLVHFSSVGDYNQYVKPICLPEESTNAGNEGDTCLVSGFGHTSWTWKGKEGYGTNSQKLLNIAIPITNHAECGKKYGGNLITDNVLCAGVARSGVGVCQNDSGGGLVCQDKDNISTWFLSGVVNFGYPCATGTHRDAFADIKKYRVWILDTMRKAEAAASDDSSAKKKEKHGKNKKPPKANHVMRFR